MSRRAAKAIRKEKSCGNYSTDVRYNYCFSFDLQKNVGSIWDDMTRILKSLLKKLKEWRFGDSADSREKVARLFRFRYACFKDLLASNTEMLTIITDFESKLRGQEVFGMSYIRSQASRAVFHTLKMVKALDDLSGHTFPMLFDRVESINVAIKEE
jgi:hypothetical protein